MIGRHGAEAAGVAEKRVQVAREPDAEFWQKVAQAIRAMKPMRE